MSDLETDQEVVEPRHFQPEVHSTLSDHNVQKREQKTTTVEAKKLPTSEAGESLLHEAVLILLSTTEMSLQYARHKPYLPDVRVCYMCH